MRRANRFIIVLPIMAVALVVWLLLGRP